MNILVIGKGGREHAIVHALSLSHEINHVHVIPGGPGMKQAVCHDIQTSNFNEVSTLAKKHKIDLVVIGPEAEIAAGLSDHLRADNFDVFAPSQQAAQLESSKLFSKQFMRKAGVPTAKYHEVHSVDETLQAAENYTAPFVLKADGLAAGKGVFICQDLEELKAAAHAIFNEKTLGEAGDKALLEESLSGWELSYLVLTNGQDYIPLPLAQDHKRLLENDEGPNTGGMGVVSPLNVDINLEDQIHEQILKPSVEQLKKDGMLYRGVLYVGIMITAEGPKVLEYNVRFGDPEAQVILPLLDGDWAQVFKIIAKGDLPNLNWKPIHAACVVLAAENYPASPVKGTEIEGAISYQSASSYFLHAGTTKDDEGRWRTNGGRVLNAIGIGSSTREAVDNAYAQAEKVYWQGQQMRRDIGQKILAKKEK